MIDLDFILLNLILLATFVITGKKLSCTNSYQKNLFFCVVAFIIIMGSRYMRGNDYVRYQLTFMYDNDEDQVIFTLLNQFLRNIGVGRHYFLYYYSFPFIVCAIYFMKSLRRYACYTFPCFIVAFTFFNEYCIRQALGFSFIFMFMFYLFKINDWPFKQEKWYKYYIWCFAYAALSVGIHSVNGLTILFITLIYILSNSTIPSKISIPAYLFSAFVFSSLWDWSYIEILLKYLANIDGKFNIYINRSSLFFSADSFQDDWSRSFFGTIFQTLGHCSLFYLGNKIIKNLQLNRTYYTLFNVYVIGTIIDIGFWNYELIRRVFDPMLAFWCFVLPIVLVNKRLLKWKSWELLLPIFLLFFIKDYLSYLFNNELTLFLWDR